MASAALQVDSRQQKGKHDKKHAWFEQHGVKLFVSKLYAGDYMLVGGTTSVDTKRDIAELCSDIDGQHVRFRNECLAAQEVGIKLVVLVENTEGVTNLDTFALWRESDKDFKRRNKTGKARRRYGKRFSAACRTMQEKYGVSFEFCTPDEAGQRICEILGLEVSFDA